MKKLYLLTFLFANLTAYTQGPANWWYFGNGAGMNFNTRPPTVVTNGAMYTTEGVASISDAAGNLLFYTDGITVYNANNVTMTNGTGLLGDPSSTQSAVIVQKPGSSTLYYIFTVSLPGNPGGISYSIVDMTLGGGLGAVTVKNVLVYTPSTERICAVKHCNNKDIWIVSHYDGSNAFYANLLTSAGLNLTPVISSSGSVSSGGSGNGIGCLKVSPNGAKLGIVMRYTTGGSSQSIVEMDDFNNNTGVVSNALSMGGGYSYGYGIEFSPDGTRLYVNSTSPSFINQYDLCAGSPAQVVASKTQIGTSTASWMGTMQIAPDGKIYVAQYSSGYLGVINNPNVAGTGCNYVDNGLNLAGRQSQFGLPNFVASYYFSDTPVIASVISASNCLHADFSYTVPNQISCTGAGTNPLQSLAWHFGDPASGAADSSNLASASHTFTSQGTYHIQLILNYACYSDTTLYPLVITACGMQVTATGDTICNSTCGSVSASASGTPPYTYQWIPNIGTGPGPYSVCPTITTGYKVIVTDANASVDSAIATVVVNTPPVVTATADSVICNGQSNGSVIAQVTGNAPYTYSWNTNPVQTGDTALSLQAGTYRVVVTDVNGCTGTAIATVEQPPVLIATISNTVDASCVGVNNGLAAVTATGGTGTYTYSWNTNPAQTNPAASNLAAGVYIVTVTDANGCTDTANATISTMPLFTLTAVATNANCGIDNGTVTATASGGGGGFSYSWNTNPVQTTSVISNLAAGNYAVTVTDVNGCSDTAGATVSASPPLTAATSVTNTNCAGNNGTATVTANGGLGNYDYNWSTTPAQTTITAVNLGAGNYQVTVTDSTGCTVSASATIILPGNPTASITASTNVSCNGGNNGMATVTANGGGGTYTYSWSTNPVQTSATAGNLAAATYTVTTTDNNFCAVADTVIITQPAAITVSLTPTSSSCGLSNGSMAASAGGGMSPLTYAWNTNPVQTGDTALNLAPGSYTITVTDNNACTQTASGIVQAISPVVLSLVSETDVSCFGFADGIVKLSGTGGISPYQYSEDNTSFNASPDFSSLTPGNYTFYIKDAGNCEDTLQTVINSPALLTADITATQLACYGNENGSASVLVNGGTPPYNYSWNTNPVLHNATITSLTANTYSVTVTDNNNCTAEQAVTLNEPQQLSITLNPFPESTITFGDSIVLTANATGNGAMHYMWQPGHNLNCDTCSSIVVSPGAETVYIVTATDTGNCQIQAQVKIHVYIPTSTFIPNAFSPNGDGKNDMFMVYAINVYRINLKIFDRWGELVFESENLNEGWDGRFKGQPEPAGVYVYTTQITYLDSRSENLNGSFTLLR